MLSAFAGMLLLAPSAAGVPGDPTPPEVTPTVIGTLGSNGWYRSSVTVSWTVVDPESIILGTECAIATTLTADTPGQKLTCRAWSDGGETIKSVTIKLDKTPPSAAPVPSRLPDANGWYNRPLAVSFSGADATSGLQSCSSAHYGGPDNGTASVLGSCVDNAGNGTATSFAFKYDATAPSLFGLTTQRGNRSAQLAWRKSADAERVEVWRAPGRSGAGESVVYQGAAAGYRDTGLVVGRKYEYRVASIDQAANRAEQKVDLVATGALLSPTPGERVTSPPYLRWTPVKGASYYNVQLIRGHKVLSVWPARPGFRLRRTWIYNGRRYRLRPGLYRWYVWPGLGRISKARYGRLLGSSTFVVSG
jgi:hypothetical protein